MNYQYLSAGLALIVLIQLIINIILFKSKKSKKKEIPITQDQNKNIEKELSDLKLQLDHTILELQKANKKMKDTELKLEKSSDELKDTQFKLERVSCLDTLTNIPNKEEFNKRAIIELKRCNREKLEMSIIMGNIDDLKKINDNFGYECGDIVLIHCANIINESIRPYDTLARWSEEEFIVLLPQTALVTAKTVSERIKSNIEYSSVSFKDQPHKVTISVGLACLNNSENLDQCIQRAYLAVQKSKERGKNQVSF